jgi:hypothetical protein
VFGGAVLAQPLRGEFGKYPVQVLISEMLRADQQSQRCFRDINREGILEGPCVSCPSRDFAYVPHCRTYVQRTSRLRQGIN